jgi:hypothetical protein
MEKSSDIAAPRERRLFDPYLALPQGVSEPLLKGVEFDST